MTGVINLSEPPDKMPKGEMRMHAAIEPDRVIDAEFVDLVNTKLIGKTIASAEVLKAEWIFHGVILRFTDGTHIAIVGQHDEGFQIDDDHSSVL